jgi:hypothetical protein
MKAILRILSFSLCATLIGLWPAGSMAQSGGLDPCAFPSPGNIFGFASGGAAARATIVKRTIRCLQARGQLPATGAAGGSGSFITFDPPGSTHTNPSAIAPDGTVTGYYVDAGGVQHGFLRTPTGSITSFDPPGSTLTQPTSIAPTGEITGVYCVAGAPGCTFFAANHGFVRASNGTFTTFDAPVPNLFASIYTLFGGAPPSINPAGAVAGTYFDESGGEHGLLRAGNGTLTTIDAPGSTGNTEVLAINPSGVIVGDLFCCAGFVRTHSGSFTTIESPDICPGTSIPTGGINPAGAIAGITADPSCSVTLGFLRAIDGTITTFGVPGAIFITPQAINPAGVIAGGFLTSAFHGFLKTPDAALTAFDVPGSFGTWATGINASGVNTGWYFDANGAAHGFLRLR